MDAPAARLKLVAQHAQLRAHLERCSRLARRLLGGAAVHRELDAQLALLRIAFAEHNGTETAVVRALLQNSAQWGAQLVDRMLEEHVAEHTAFWELLAGSAAVVAERMEDLVDELDAHMAAEERTFLSPAVLRNDVITRHAQGEPAA
jgi:iron-sulfur cluster repair protein YtfE (RIC family)